MPSGQTTPAKMIQSEAERLTEAAGNGFDLLVPRYAGWRVRDVVVHTGSVHRRVHDLVHDRALEPNRRRDWRGAVADGELLRWFGEGVSDLLAVLAETPAAARVWFFGQPAPIGAWGQRMVHETVIHRWDVESASRTPGPIARPVAVSGLHEAVALYVERLLSESALADGQMLQLVPTDANRPVWLMSQGGRLEVVEVDQAAAAICSLGGTAADLWS